MINLNEAKKDMWREVNAAGEIRHCFACSSCIVGCPASEAQPPLLIRNLARMVLLGLEDDLLDEDTPWTCVTCSRCEEVCPMGVNPFELVLMIRRWQCRNDATRLPPSIVEIYHRGYTQPVDGADEVRKSVGLTGKLPTLSAFPDLLKKFQDMLMEVELIKANDYMFGSK
jgi:heterodisulfide reductase subunit C